MKAVFATLFLAVAAGVSAQNSTMTNAPAPLTTQYYDDCDTTGTVTNITTKTYCPECEMSKNASMGMLTTTYQTVYAAYCPTGLTSSTYTITESCSCTALPTRGANYIPSGFSAYTSSVCTVCTGTASGMTASQTIIAPCSQCAAASTQTGVASRTSTSAGAGAVTPGFTTHGYAASSGYVSPTVIGNTTVKPTITPFTGAASTVSFSVTAAAGVVGAIMACAFYL
ncbi:MAG: hypothetical protein M1827_000732 [Pycnora praestabilis]|nr:MAG: hypothetical protein M1827_000732 [Pycnora praestabilis]